MYQSSPSPVDRAIAAITMLIAAALLLTALFSGDTVPRTIAAAPESTPTLSYVIVTATPLMASHVGIVPIAQQKPAQLPTATPELPVVPIVAVEPPVPELPAPAFQIIYQVDGSAELPGVDGSAVAPALPVDAAQQAQLAADAALYKSLPRAGDPPLNPRPLTIKSHGHR
jgi:hypothetical protein